jgi:hypothetical protein
MSVAQSSRRVTARRPLQKATLRGALAGLLMRDARALTFPGG